MIILGDSLIAYEDVFRVYHKEQISESPSNSTLIFKYNPELLQYASKNELPSAVMIGTLKEAIYANALNAKYIIANKSLAKEVQKVADNYMFDTKVLAIIESNEEFEQIALDEIDGVIYKNILD